MNNLINCTKKTIACGLVSMAIVCSMIFGVSAASTTATKAFSITGDYTWVTGNLKVTYDTSTKKVSSSKITVNYYALGVKNITTSTKEYTSYVTGTTSATLGTTTKSTTVKITL